MATAWSDRPFGQPRADRPDVSHRPRRLYDARRKAGLDGYLGALVAQQALISAQQALVNVRLSEQANLVTLYKMLAGGV